MMVERFVRWWQGLARRDRRVLLVGAWVIVLVLTYVLGFEPAWRGRQTLLSELPGLRSELAQMGAMADEARRLSGARGQPADSPQRVRAQLEAGLQAAGLWGDSGSLTVTGAVIDLRLRAVPVDRWLSWLDGALRETRCRVVDAMVERANQPGLIDVHLTFEGSPE
jgi:general secretion pathway protein M